MSGIRVYVNERFPVALVIPLSLATAALIAGSIATFDHPHGYALLTVLMASAMFFFLLRQRVTDEFKDARHDGANYPNRPLQRGAITRRQLVWLGAIATFAELTCVLLATIVSKSPYSPIWYLIFLIFSLLTAKEFFVGKWLEKHFNIYFISHQLIFIPYAMWAFVLFKVEPTDSNFVAVYAFVLWMASVEIARKYEVRLDPKGVPVRDTYLTVWGRNGSILIAALTTGLGSTLLYRLDGNSAFLVIQGLLTVALFALRDRPEAVRTSIILAFLAQSAVSFAL